jgi:hypothetical protein
VIASTVRIEDTLGRKKQQRRSTDNRSTLTFMINMMKDPRVDGGREQRGCQISVFSFRPKGGSTYYRYARADQRPDDGRPCTRDCFF